MRAGRTRGWRLRGKDGFEAAYADLVADLRVAPAGALSGSG